MTAEDAKVRAEARKNYNLEAKAIWDTHVIIERLGQRKILRFAILRRGRAFVGRQRRD